MATVTMRGNEKQTVGELPPVGSPAPDFTLVGTDSTPVSLHDTDGKIRILSIVPSVDTSVCSLQTKRFNQELDTLPDSVIGYTISVDTPFAQKRYCGAEGVEKMKLLSDFKGQKFAHDYGVYIPETGFMARSVLILDKQGNVAYTQLVTEISQEPNYDEVLQKARELA